MLKKFISLLLIVALTATISIAGTAAYFTDEDSAVNVMTVGNVQVELEEKQRNEDGSALVDFVQNKPLTPLVGSAQGEKDDWGQPVAENYVDKIVYATNTGKNDAYVRILVALPKELVQPENNTDNILHWNYGNRVDITGEGKYNEGAFKDSDWDKAFEYADIEGSVTIDGEEYIVTYFTMQEALEPGEETLAVMAGMYLDKRVDYDADLGKYTFDGVAFDYDLSKGVKVPVLVQAVQTDGWTVNDAFKGAFGEVNVDNAEEWFANVKAPTMVSSADELADALADGGDAVLTEDIEKTPDITAPYNNKTAYIQNGGTLDGAGNTLDMGEPDDGDNYGVMTSGGTVKNVTIQNSDRAIMIMAPTEDIIIKNVTITDNVMYPINTGEKGADGVNLVVENSVLGGWTSFEFVESASFTDCTFKQGTYYNNIYGRVLKPYVTTDIKNCEFDKAYNLDLSKLGAECTVTIENCTVGGVSLTADTCTINPSDYDNCTFSIDLPSGRTLEDCVIFK